MATIAQETGCVVYAPMGFIYGDLNKLRTSKIIKEYEEQSYPEARDDTFAVFYPDGKKETLINRQ